MTRMLAVLAALVVAGCSTTGVPINRRQFASVEVGKSTVAEVRRNLGPPTDVLVGTDGRAEMTWQWSESQATAESFIPIASSLGGAGMTGSTTKVVVRFDRAGVVSEVLRGGSSISVQYGVLVTGYKATGDQRGHNGDLPEAPKLPERAYQKCESDDDCGMDLVCGVPTATGRRCIPKAQ